MNTIPVTYTKIGAHGAAEIFTYEYEEPVCGEIDEETLISCAVAGEPHYGGSVDHEAQIVTVFTRFSPAFN